MKKPQVLVVSNFASHYRAPLFSMLQERIGAEFIFYSEGTEAYWQPHLGVSKDGFRSTTVASSLRLGKLRLSSALFAELAGRAFDVLVVGLGGRAELPTALAVARAKRAAVVVWTGLWAHPRTPFHIVARPLTRLLYRSADAVLTYGRHVSEHVFAESSRTDGVFAADNATDNLLYGRAVTKAEIARTRLACGAEERSMLLAVSRLVPEKGLDVLVDAVAGIDAMQPVVVVVGTGPLGDELERLSKMKGVRLLLAGGVQPAQLPAYYAAADVFVMPSVTTSTFREPWGLACNEAMLQGTPVIASDAVGAAAGGLVENGVTGLVVPEQNSRLLGEAIVRVLSNDELAARVSSNGLERVSRVNYESMASAFCEAVDHAFARRARGCR